MRIRKSFLILILSFMVVGLQAQILTPKAQRFTKAFVKETPGKYKLSSTPVDTTVFMWSANVAASGVAYDLKNKQNVSFLSAVGFGVSYGKYKKVNGIATCIFDVNVDIMTKLQIQSTPFAPGFGGLISVGVNPGYLLGIPSIVMIREGFMELADVGLKNFNPYLVTGVTISF
jgi:hypothetical protein